MKTIAVLVAMPMEAAPLIKRMEGGRPETRAGKKFLCGRMGRAEVVLHICGMGMRNAARGAKSLVENYQPDVLVNFGVSGGFVPGIALFDTIIAQSSCPASSRDDKAEPMDERLANFAKQVLPHAQIAPVATSIGLIVNKKRKARLAAKCGAVCIDMETYAIAKISRELGVPLLVIRCMSDTVEPSSLLHFFKNGALAAEKVAGELESVISRYDRRPAGLFPGHVHGQTLQAGDQQEPGQA